jgi:molybdopterin/thiamine biosynthesis adenylyltransferase
MSDMRFQRNLGVISPETAKKLSSTHVLIAGVGGAGGQAAIDLARLGFGCLTLADFDRYEIHNMNRQAGCFEQTVGKVKIDVVGEMVRNINPSVRLRLVHDGITQSNAETLLAESELPRVDYVIEVIDIAGAEAKSQLHEACRKQGVVAMTGLMLGMGASLHVFQPDAPTYDEAFLTAEGKYRWDLLAPATGSYMLKEYLDACFRGKGHAPTCVIGATSASALMVSEIMRGVILGKQEMVSYPEFIYVDFVDHRYVRGDVRNISK